MDASAAIFPVSLPLEVIQRMQQFEQYELTGQIILNYNRGEIQSFEPKEHCRIRKDRLTVPD